ncbi:MAG: hypothetical protein Q7R39_08065 [Dehalococcoidia bacterium]|nr:hypothetical protein [Dehalococcoidia bacterium]
MSRAMLAEKADQPFNSPLHLFEKKWNGVRLLALKLGGKVRLEGRSGIDYTAQFPDLADAIAKAIRDDGIIDGEAVCLDKSGQPSFNLVQQRIGKRGLLVKLAAERFPATYMAFDILQLGDQDETSRGKARPLWQRQALLHKVLAESEKVQISQAYAGDQGVRLFEQELAAGQEGVMAKLKSSLYVPGARNSSWLKVKVSQKDTFTICGYTAGAGWRERLFGAVVLGKLESGRLRFVGCAGSGFTLDGLEKMLPKLQKLRTDTVPFPGTVPGLVSWVKPTIKVQIKYGDTTKDGQLIWPIFQKVVA